MLWSYLQLHSHLREDLVKANARVEDLVPYCMQPLLKGLRQGHISCAKQPIIPAVVDPLVKVEAGAFRAPLGQLLLLGDFSLSHFIMTKGLKRGNGAIYLDSNQVRQLKEASNVKQTGEFLCLFRWTPEVYPVHTKTRISLGEMTLKLSVTVSEKLCQFRGTFWRRKSSMASAKLAQVG
jgi:hypothetical protein